MSGTELFEALPCQAQPDVSGRCGAPRLREPQRDQVELRPVDLNSLIGSGHHARVIWSYVEGLDLSALEDRIKARGDRPGHPAISPRLMLALWIYATSQGVGSARALERLCNSHDVYRWLCGGVSVNYHTLTDFRVGSADLLDRLLTEHLAVLAKAGLVDLTALAQDGVRIRASAATGSFRRQATLDRHLETAQAVVAQLKQEVQAGVDASERRIQAARRRAAEEREERLRAAQTALAELERKRAALDAKGGNGKTPKPARASTTDADARVMKMADAGFRPAYNVQVASTAGGLIVVAVDVTNTGSDQGLMRPMLDRLRTLPGRGGALRHLVDGGYGNADDIEWAHDQGIEVYCPAKQSKTGADPYRPRRNDAAGMAAWRARMGSDAGKAEYKKRTICECIHARWRNWGLRQFTVRGLAKIRAVSLLYALTNNVLQARPLATA
jgi:transposase